MITLSLLLVACHLADASSKPSSRGVGNSSRLDYGNTINHGPVEGASDYWPQELDIDPMKGMDVGPIHDYWHQSNAEGSIPHEDVSSSSFADLPTPLPFADTPQFEVWSPSVQGMSRDEIASSQHSLTLPSNTENIQHQRVSPRDKNEINEDSIGKDFLIYYFGHDWPIPSYAIYEEYRFALKRRNVIVSPQESMRHVQAAIDAVSHDKLMNGTAREKLYAANHIYRLATGNPTVNRGWIPDYNDDFMFHSPDRVPSSWDPEEVEKYRQEIAVAEGLMGEGENQESIEYDPMLEEAGKCRHSETAQDGASQGSGSSGLADHLKESGRRQKPNGDHNPIHSQLPIVNPRIGKKYLKDKYGRDYASILDGLNVAYRDALASSDVRMVSRVAQRHLLACIDADIERDLMHASSHVRTIGADKLLLRARRLEQEAMRLNM